MHKSRLAGFIIDCETQDLDAAAKFWSEALGCGIKEPSSAADAALYRNLDSAALGIHVEVQQVKHPSRVHLDIEADDIDAEVARLEKLGAKRLQKVHTWWVMEAPTGQRFCVVRVQNPGEFEKSGNRWP
jgi:predicted enzyme related to lactoylglutathione lyase